MVEFEIKQQTESLAERRAAQKQRQFVQKIILLSTLAAIVVVGAMVVSRLNQVAVGPPAVAADDGAVPGAAPHQDAVPEDKSRVADEPASSNQPPKPQLVDDDGQTMWVSPTTGPPLELVYLPAETQLLLILRPADLQATGEMEQIIAALGPRGATGLELIERSAGRRWGSIDQIVVAMYVRPDYTSEVVVVVTPNGSLGEPTTIPGYDVWIPAGANHYIVAPPAVLAELKELPPQTILRRDFEELLARSDRQRHVTLLMANSLVASPTVPLWQGAMGGLRTSAFGWLPDETQAFALSLHWGDSFFVELRLVATLDQRPEKFAERLAQRIITWPATAEETITSLSLQPYSRKVIARLPAMLREVVRYTRAGRDERYALLRCYLPRPAGENLLAAGELLLAEQYAGPTTQAQPVADTTTPKTLAERLQTSTSLSFARDTLEVALLTLAEDSGITIELAGADLQLEGITKNQSFALDLHDKPVGEILVEILRQANPDKTATGLADPKQKLVYVIINGPEGSQSIKVTTRSQAEKRGETLPRIFVQ